MIERAGTRRAASSRRLSRHARSSHGTASRGVSRHQPTATSPSKASKPGGCPRRTISRNATLFWSRGLLREALPIRQDMHQQPTARSGACLWYQR